MAAGVGERPARSSRVAMTWTELPRGWSGWRLKEPLTRGIYMSISGGREGVGGALVHTKDMYIYIYGLIVGPNT